MTLYGLIASLAWTAVAVLFVARLDRFAAAWLDSRDPASSLPEAIVIPPDLEGLALQETEKWAQDSVLSAIRERFDALKDWNKVRHALGVAEVSA